MPLIVGANISLRYLTGHSLSWADEAARYLMIWMTFIGAGLALRLGAHVAITNLQDALPGPGQKILRGLLVVVLLIFFGFMVSVGIEYAQRMQYQLSPALRLPFIYVYAAMPAGFSLADRPSAADRAAIRDGRDLQGRRRPATATPPFARARMAEILFPALFVLLALGLPVAFAMAISVFVALSFGSSYPNLVVVKEMFAGLDSFPLLAVPFFILAAEIMTAGAVTMAILRLAQSLVGHLRGGLGHANVVSSAMFAGISGSALADAAGPGAMMVRMMEKGGYDRAYAGALTISSAVVGPIIPPSITMIIYAMQDQQVSVGSLFMAGVLPGILITVMVLLANAQVSRQRGYASGGADAPAGRDRAHRRSTLFRRFC